jgi:uncharacterized cupredoxin-like copper-binding protein
MQSLRAAASRRRPRRHTGATFVYVIEQKGVFDVRPRLISVVVLIAALALSGVAFASTQSSSVVAPIKITVTLRDYSIGFSRASVPKGSSVVFTVKNAGAVAHNVDFVGTGKRTAVIGPGVKTTLKVTFKKKGTIQVVCDVPRHIQLGMVSSFKVK